MIMLSIWLVVYDGNNSMFVPLFCVLIHTGKWLGKSDILCLSSAMAFVRYRMTGSLAVPDKTDRIVLNNSEINLAAHLSFK